MNVRHAGSAGATPQHSHASVLRVFGTALGVLGAALTLRLIFLGLTADTYDYDEFVLLLLSRDFAHGAVPYAGFEFFHPPGMLVVLRALEPLTAHWWPIARIFTAVLDTGTAGLVYLIGCRIWDRRTGMIAGLLYAASPLALVSAVRVGQDPVITFLGVAGLWALLRLSDWRGAVLAGAFLAAAFWVKYPAAYFLPVYLLAAPRRFPLVAGSALVCGLALFLPFHAQWDAMYRQTVTFQRTRWRMATDVRLQTAALWWLGVNFLALVGLWLRPRFPWLLAGFLLGGVFVFTAQVYYHYFVPVVPFGALAGAAALARLPRFSVAAAVPVALSAVLAWGLLLDRGGAAPIYVTAAHLSKIAPTVALIDRRTQPADPVLADRLEYAFLARRPATADYFWNIGTQIGPGWLKARIGERGLVVMSYGASSGYPPKFVRFLYRHYRSVYNGTNTVWFLAERKA